MTSRLAGTVGGGITKVTGCNSQWLYKLAGCMLAISGVLALIPACMDIEALNAATSEEESAPTVTMTAQDRMILNLVATIFLMLGGIVFIGKGFCKA